MKEDFIASTRRSDAPSKGGIKYRKLEDRTFVNNFNEKDVARSLPREEKKRGRRKKKIEYNRRSCPRPPAERVEYLCNGCGQYEERFQSWVHDESSKHEAYFCKECLRGNGSGQPRRRKVNKD